MKPNNSTQNELDNLVGRLSLAYLAVRGCHFEYLGVRLPLGVDVLTMAIHNNVVGAILEQAGSRQGRGDALMLLRHMLVSDELAQLGLQVLDEMNRAFCADVRQMLDEGKDPATELASESKRRAMQG